MNKPIVFYDGVCGLCNRLVQFLLTRDKHDRLLFASLQSDFAAKVLTRHGIDPKDLDTLHVVENYEQSDESVLERSDAILRAGKELGGIWAEVADLGAKVPQDIRDRFYRFVAKNRYYMFGKYQTCMLPEPEHRAKFLDME